MPDVSVVVIVYNDAERLTRAVRSVLSQSLRDLEVIIADDCSTDSTPAVARELQAADPRVRYLRLESNSGGCSAPRNAGMAAVRAPYVMFLDSDDELPRHACKSLLLVAERTGVDFVTGEVTRFFEETKTKRLWYPELFDEVRVVEGIRQAPEYFHDHLSTNKLYRADFLASHDLRFPPGIHYEDQLFTAQAFTLARSFAVVPWPVYTWRLSADPAGLSISSSRHKLRNVADRIAVARLIDSFLIASGNADLRPFKDEKFLRHDLRLYLGDLPFREREWTEQFAELLTPYLDEVTDEAISAVCREQRICQYLLRSGRLDEAIECSRSLGRPRIAPRRVARESGRMYWGRSAPADHTHDCDHELDISEWHLDEQPFTAAPIRHEVHSLKPAGRVLRLTLRTYDPARLLRGPEKVTTQLWLSAGDEPLKIPFEYVLAGGGRDVYTAFIELDLRRIPLSAKGFKGRRHPTVVLERLGTKRNDVVLAPGDLPPLRAHLPSHGMLAGHDVRVACEGRGTGRLEFTWTRSRALARAETMAPHLWPVRKRVRQVQRRFSGPRAKALIYHELLKLPADNQLIVFEALEGRGYADSPRYIHEELVRRGSPLRAVWSYSGDRSAFPEGVRLVKRGSWEYVRTLARARYWVDSHGFPSIYPKRPGTRYLQTWHGQAIKHMGFDLPSLRFGSPERQQKHRDMISRWDALISPSEEFERTFVRANEFTGELLACGLPRNDVLVRFDEPEQRERARAARARLQIPEGRRMLLYAPTFRDGNSTGGSIRVDLAELVDKTSHEWVVVVRPHYYERFTVPRELGHAVRDGRGFSDINDLLLASDALLTDYSSVMFDYANLGRPILLFTDDYEEYSTSARGTYYNLPEIAPGPMLTTTGELAKVMGELDRVQMEWADPYARFQATFNSHETGRASETVVDLFFEGGNR
ncbi:CDP-glycerol glycerophosphotransferase family protein [Streptomyces sp. ISL-100]|uniref:bifunctional glycosyltransferase/CDP-glycerol:glycerophosphate glycerophosphotransferase n=1 Tax=Streptomyces sp. ISL-100 TaxID=2819173 RepID=UPI0027E489EB|nr:CDP-glycerol glycerophosphotransferase family protein [Streptomyces sp. ISL-100]